MSDINAASLSNIGKTKAQRRVDVGVGASELK